MNKSGKIDKGLMVILVLLIVGMLVTFSYKGYFDRDYLITDSNPEIVAPPSAPTNTQNLGQVQNAFEENLKEFETDWSYYQSILNYDQKQLEKLVASGKYANTQTEIEDLLDDLERKIDTYNTHLVEARAFLNKYGDAIYAQPHQNNIDESWENLNEFIDELNEKIKEYNQQFS